MTIEEIKEIIQVLQESGVAELEVQRGENRVWVRRSATVEAAPVMAVAAPVAAAMPVASAPAVSVPAIPAVPDANLITVKAPIVGTYYDAPSPGAAPFVKVGDAVQPGQVLCIIESMKLMNEIEAEQAGVITAKLTANGKPVEYGEALFTLRPL